MEKQAFSNYRIGKTIRKSDFINIKKSNQETYRINLITESIQTVNSIFSYPNNPLYKFTLKNNVVFTLKNKADQIVERKLMRNLREACNYTPPNRYQIIENINSLLKEGIPYKIYRLDIRKFFESFSKEEVIEQINTLTRLSPTSKVLIKAILDHHKALNGHGIPRGLPISSVLTELMMNNFDSKIKNLENVFFYSRYVDDIIIISSSKEETKTFLNNITKSLPNGLTLNPTKLYISNSTTALKEIANNKPRNIVASFEYLGYQFDSINPYKKLREKYRVVDINIAYTKINKYKLRISRAFYDFYKSHDFRLLEDRIKYLSNNFRIFNVYVEKTKLVGIYYNYPALSGDLKTLKELDHYLRGLIFSKGRLGKIYKGIFTNKMKRRLLTKSFLNGYTKRNFIYFSPNRLEEITKCWSY